MLKVGLIGCGTKAEDHLVQIDRIPYAKLVGVCDRELLLAKHITSLYDVKKYFNSVQELIDTVKPDVAHIVTPPSSHYEIAKICLQNNVNVYVEKPFTLFYHEAKELINIAEQKQLKITVGNNVLFSPPAIEMRNLIKNGYLGGPPCHMESIYCYNWENENYAKFIIENKNHWMNNLPGKLFQEIISHGISKIAQYITCDNPEIFVSAYKGHVLEKIGLGEILDELRVIIKGDNCSAYFTFSGTIKPIAHSFKVYGPKRSIEFDQIHHTLIKYENNNSKHFLKFIRDPLLLAKQYRKNALLNFKQIRKHKLNKGIYLLIDEFYKSILNNENPPVSYREILLTSKIMEDILEKVYPNAGFNQNRI